MNGVIKKINKLKSVYADFSEEELKNKTEEFLSSINNKKNNYKKLLPNMLAVFNEALLRGLGISLFDNQIESALLMNKGLVVQTSAGEGKSFSVLAAAYLSYMLNGKVHIAEADEFLLQREFNKAQRIFKLLGLKVGVIVAKDSVEYEEINKTDSYNCDIVFVNLVETAFDFMKKKVDLSNIGLVIDDIDRILAKKEPEIVVLINEQKSDYDKMPLVEFVKNYKSFSGTGSFLLKNLNFFKKVLSKKTILVKDNIKSVKIEINDDISRTKTDKYDKILDEVLEIHKYRCPIIVGVPYANDLSEITSRFEKKGLNFSVVNGLNINKDAFETSQAGRLNQVTIICKENGVDIPTGGDSFYLALATYKSFNINKEPALEDSQWRDAYGLAKKTAEVEKQEVESLGGIYSIVTEHSDMDDYFKSLSARRGEAGSVKFFVSLQDDSMKNINIDRFLALINKFNLNEGIILNNTLVSTLLIKYATLVNSIKDRLVK